MLCYVFPKLPIKTPIAKWAVAMAILVYGVFVCTSCVAQNGQKDFTRYDTRHGLPHEHITSIAQDNDGFIWVGTLNGLSKYNGHEFENFTLTNQGNKHSYENVIGALHCDEDGLWAGSSAGILAFLTDSSTWHTISLPLRKNGLPYSITCLNSNRQSIFMGCFNGSVITLDKQTRETDIQQISVLPIYQMAIDHQNLIVLSEESTKTIKLDEPLEPALDALPTSSYGAIAYNNRSFVYGDTSGFKIFHSKTSNVSTVSLSKPTERPGAIFSFKKGFIHIANDRATLFDTLGQIEDVYELDRQANSLPTYTVNCVFESENDVTWLGTSSGLLKLIKTPFEFKKYQPGNGQHHMPYAYVRGMYADQEGVLMGTKRGKVMRMRLGIPYEKRTIETLPIEGNAHSGFATVNTFLKLKNGHLLAAGLENIWLLRNDSFIPYPAFQNCLTEAVPQIWSLAEDSLGRLWVGTLGNGLFLLNLKDGSFEKIGVDEGLSSETVWNLTKDQAGTIWIGTQKGLDSVSYTREKTTITPLSKMLDATIDGKEIWHLLEDEKQNLWIGTTDNGLAYFDRRKRKITNYHASNGLKSEAIAGLALNSDESKLWISTINGLHALDLATNRISEWGIEDGLLSNEFNFKSIAITKNDELFLGSKSGLVSFNTQRVKPVGGTHQLRITSWQTEGVWRPSVSEVNLSKQQRNLSLRFCLLEYSVPSKHWYRYKLEGFDQDWQYINSTYRTATYTNIPPGGYTFLVEASLNKNWKTAGQNQLSITVTPKLIEMLWFQLVLALLLLTLTSSFIFLGFWRYNEKNRIRTRVAELERRMLTAQMNPHFLFNSMNTIQHFILTHDSESANTYLNRFSRLIRMFLEASSRKLISVENELQLLRTFTELEQMRFENRFTSTFSIDPSLPLQEIEIPSALVQPFVENAILHGLAPKTEGGELHISFKKTNGALQITVEDNGVGRKTTLKNDTSTAHTSSGMKLVNDLTNTYRNLDGFPKTDIEIIDKKDKTGNPLGTKVILTIHLI